MLRKSCLAVMALFSFVSLGCRTPYGGSCPGGCCGGSCSTGAAYAPAPQTYAPGPQGYAPSSQQALPPSFGGGSGGGSGSR